MRRTPRLLLPATALAAVLATSACGAGDDPQEPPSAASYQVPGVPVSVTAPAGWDRSTQDGSFVVRSPDAFGEPSFRANVVVTGEESPGTLDEAGAATAEHVESIAGWRTDAEGQGSTTLGDAPAYRVSGTFDADGVRVAQEVLLVASDAAGEPWVAYLTASHAEGDAEGAEQVRAVLESVEVAPGG